jgi:hypothetical protein
MSQQPCNETVRTYREMQDRSEASQPGQMPLAACALTVDAKGGLARVVLVQRFVNSHAEPLSVTYKLPLPEDAAVSDFGFTVGTRRVQGIVQRKADARETYERALASGRSAALLEQERASLFVQEIGNVPPGESLEVRITLDQPLVWIADAANEGTWNGASRSPQHRAISAATRVQRARISRVTPPPHAHRWPWSFATQFPPAPSRRPIRSPSRRRQVRTKWRWAAAIAPRSTATSWCAGRWPRPP